MAKDKYQVSLKVFLKDDKGRILFLRASSKGSYAGYYDMPGGRIEDTELHTPLMDILRREVVEELGNISFEVDPRPVLISRDEIGPNKETHVIYVFYEGKYLGGEIKTSNEHEGLVWEYSNKLDIDRHIKPIHRETFKNFFKK